MREKTYSADNMQSISFEEMMKKQQAGFHPVVPFDKDRDQFYRFDFTSENPEFAALQIDDTDKLADYINAKLKKQGCRYGIGGYKENRDIYSRSRLFDAYPGKEEAGGAEPRRLHLGIDIWGPAGTKVMAPLDGIIHSFAFNNNYGDYGTTIILTHNIDGWSFHTLYGHLSLNSIKNLREGTSIKKGDVFTEFGMRFENGNWPPHLHFQLIRDMQGREGDYPGVCRLREKDQWLDNCPDPALILGIH